MKNDVASFMYYMWNTWCEDECAIVFAGDFWPHYWSKWCGYQTKHGGYGEAEFFASLSTDGQNKLVARATELYNGRTRIA